jgi:hypothetical protein
MTSFLWPKSGMVSPFRVGKELKIGFSGHFYGTAAKKQAGRPGPPPLAGLISSAIVDNVQPLIFLWKEAVFTAFWRSFRALPSG